MLVAMIHMCLNLLFYRGGLRVRVTSLVVKMLSFFTPFSCKRNIVQGKFQNSLLNKSSWKCSESSR